MRDKFKNYPIVELMIPAMIMVMPNELAVDKLDSAAGELKDYFLDCR